MLKVKDFISFFDLFAPSNLADDWDNVGLQLGDRDKQVKKVLLSLDLDLNAVDYAIGNDIDLIITHHPLFFTGIKNIIRENAKGEIIYKLIENNISVFSAHTNLDKTKGGVNDVLAKYLKIKNQRVLVKEDFSNRVNIRILGKNDILKDSSLDYLKFKDYSEVSIEKNTKAYDLLIKDLEGRYSYEIFPWDSYYGHGRIGFIKESSLDSYLKEVKKSLGLEVLKVYGDKNRKISKVAFSGGSGSSFIYNAYKAKADLYITGDIKYHDAQYANELGLVLVDAGHYDTEKLILLELKKILKEVFGPISIDLYLESSPICSIY